MNGFKILLVISIPLLLAACVPNTLISPCDRPCCRSITRRDNHPRTRDSVPPVSPTAPPDGASRRVENVHQ